MHHKGNHADQHTGVIRHSDGTDHDQLGVGGDTRVRTAAPPEALRALAAEHGVDVEPNGKRLATQGEGGTNEQPVG